MDLFRALYTALAYVFIFFLLCVVAFFVLLAFIKIGQLLLPGFWGGAVGLFALAIIIFFIIGIVGAWRQYY